jgi:predicted DNA binding CopG/RHH family protein
MHLNHNNRRESVLKVRFTEHQLTDVQRQATKEGMQTATWVHMQLLRLIEEDKSILNQERQLKRFV